MTIAIDYAARSHVGMVRSNNQDSGYAGPRLLAMADGMGGHAGGDIASSIVIGALVDLDDEALGSAEAGRALLARIKRANADLAQRIREEPALDGMGTTLIAILRSHNNLVLAHIGDSRAFLARGGEVAQITKDHSFVQSLVDDGKITASDAMVHPQRSLVTRVLTGRADDEPDLVVREARAGDRYLIASDGLTDYVAADTINELLVGPSDAGSTADKLVALALRAGAPDNVTVIIGDIVDVTKGRPPATVPQVVGSAAVRRKGAGATRPIPVTPAEKAAALGAETDGSRHEEPDDEITLAEQGAHSRGIRRLRALAIILAALVVLGGGAYAGYAWTQQQYYIGDHQGVVTIYQGIDARVGPIDLSHPKAISEIRVNDLPPSLAESVQRGADQADAAAAVNRVDFLRSQAAACVLARAGGHDCSVTVNTTSPTS
ncbi:MAG: protein phosphatase 2C domain-containing protein [Nostocoides sp.]